MNEKHLKLELLSGVHERVHKHFDVEVLYVLKGLLNVESAGRQYVLLREDIFLINFGEEHKLSAGRDVLFCRITIPFPLIAGGTDRDLLYFRCNTTAEDGFRYQKLKECLKELLLATVEEDNNFLLQSAEYKLLDCLTRYFAEKTVGARSAEVQRDQRLGQVLRYIYANLDKDVSLTEAAEKVVYMTPSSLSRFFHKATGESFVKYVRRARLEQAAESLSETDESISKIAVDNGFSTPSAMNKDFKSFYKVTPSEYRILHRKRQKEEHSPLNRQKILQAISPSTDGSALSGKQTCRIDLEEGENYPVWTNRILNAGPAYSLDTAALRKQIIYLKEKLKFEYIRIWSLFSNPMMIFGEEDKGDPNFSKIDDLLDFCVENQMNVFLDLGQRDNTVMASSDAVLYAPKVGILFRNREEWERFLDEFLRHIVKRYGKEVTGRWIFEFTFFLNERPYYESEKYSTKEVWNGGYHLIKKYLPEANVAGPGILVPQDEELAGSLVDSFLDNENAPDIFTSMNFPINFETGAHHYQRVTDEDFVSREAKFVRQRLAAHQFRGKYYITDWGISLANRNYIQDSCHKATDLLHTVFATYAETDAMGIFYASDLINEYYDSRFALSGSAGLISRDGIGKPALYAYEFLQGMGKYLLYHDENLLVTADDSGAIQCLTFNHKALNAGYYMVSENLHRPSEIEHLFSDHQKREVELNISGLDGHADYLIRQQIVNTKTGSVLDNWIDMGCERDLLPSDIAYLKDVSVPRVTIRTETAINGVLHLLIVLEPHEIRRISIEKK